MKTFDEILKSDSRLHRWWNNEKDWALIKIAMKLASEQAIEECKAEIKNQHFEHDAYADWYRKVFDDIKKEIGNINK